MTNDELKLMALKVLEEAARQARLMPVPRSLGLRFALAWLYAAGGGEKWLYDGFWREATRPVGAGSEEGPAAIVRSQTVNACLNGIYRAVGVERTAELQFPEESTGRRAAANDTSAA